MACNHSHAMAIATLDEDLEVDGELRLTIQKDGMTDEQATKMIQAMAEEIEI